MESLLIVSADKNKRDKYILDFCNNHSIDKFDITIIENETSLGINEARALLKKIFLKPFRSDKKAVILEEAQTATSEAQNALLKILEEPPNNTFIILSASTSRVFLPTILSRCSLILLDKGFKEIPQQDSVALKDDFYNLIQATITEKLKKAQVLSKDKQKTLSWLQSLIQIERKQMLDNLDQANSASISANLLYKLQETYTLVNTTNVNLRFLLECFFLCL